jgi:hypothetical protein
MRPDCAWPSERLLKDRLAARSSFDDSGEVTAGAVVAVFGERDYT